MDPSHQLYLKMAQAYFLWAEKPRPAADIFYLHGSFRKAEWEAYVKARDEYLKSRWME